MAKKYKEECYCDEMLRLSGKPKIKHKKKIPVLKYKNEFCDEMIGLSGKRKHRN